MDKFGIFSWFGFVMPLPERLEFIQSSGFNSTCLWWEDEEGDYTVKKTDMPKMVSDFGLTIDNIHTPFCNSNDLWSESFSARSKIIKQYLTWLEDCAKFNIPIMVMHIMEGDIVPKVNKYGIESIWQLTQEAKKLKVKIALENTGFIHGITFILSEIESEYLGLCYDSSHAKLHGDEFLLRDFGHRLVTCHISDNDGKVDRHWLPGNGVIDWESFYNSFPKEDYLGNLMLEVYPTDDEKKAGPRKFLHKAFKRISTLPNY
ncbi:MAG: sugar phosphate isomerase/epimerase [Thermoanaerobacteraceae bacterium]|nr:sugar phosphate isomerase/epimerase [Thermoanaerobacteraceae bacterium]